MKISEIIKENASAGATASGNIATVANPAVANTKTKPKKQKPSDNALNSGNSLFGAGTIKRKTSDSLASLDASKMTSG
jgi:hypothetical protein